MEDGTPSCSTAHCRGNQREMLVMFEQQPLREAPKITCTVYCVYNPVGGNRWSQMDFWWGGEKLNPIWAIFWVQSTIYKECLFYFTLWSNVARNIVVKGRRGTWKCVEERGWGKGVQRLHPTNTKTLIIVRVNPREGHTRGTNSLNILNSTFKFQPNSSSL